ncbi:hypothetical protein K443DRAFT_678706 [Laccaria amethystina LaAM-08-1]|uniref:DUF6533 domain-containing protein n=1 Tax=Laccaria amethystina LaAM-08-1 TaxID=1095629 RepID=A0A0C9WRE3_9AGAR|nr:hypothetical protein K443DRAFT_678706 [Laccaria amethystina LaAM-08-1]
MKPTFEEVVVVLQSARLRNYMTVASIVVLVYDYMLTLNSELLLVWSSRWNPVKALFLLVRYMPFIDMVFSISYLTRNGTSHTACGITFQTSAWLFVVGASVAEILLTIRTWACWDRARWLTIGLPIFFLVIWVIVYVFLDLFLRSVVFIRPPHDANPFGCFHAGAKPMLVACWAAMMVYDAGLLLLMGIRGFPIFVDMERGTLSKVVYRDGLIYYLFLFGLSLVNLVTLLCLPHEYMNLLTALERVMYSILTCRAILHIREQNQIEPTGCSFDLSV